MLIQRFYIHVFIKRINGQLYLLGVIGRNARTDGADVGGGLKGARLYRDNGYHRLQTFNQPDDRRFGLTAGGEHNTGYLRITGRQVGL